MLDIASERDSDGDLCLHDLGDGLPFRPGSFDGAISISAVQWLCNAVCASDAGSCQPSGAVLEELPVAVCASQYEPDLTVAYASTCRTGEMQIQGSVCAVSLELFMHA